MKRKQLFWLIPALLLGACSVEEENEEPLAIAGNWKLEQRHNILEYPNPSEITKSCILQIAENGAVVLSDSLLNYFWEGQLTSSINPLNGNTVHEIDFGGNYLYTIHSDEEGIIIENDRIYTRHTPILGPTACFPPDYSDTFVRIYN